MTRGACRQRGVTLVIALVFLAVITLIATSTLNTTSTNLKVVGNMQWRGEALDAAQQAIEVVLSTPQFLATPADAVPNPCDSANTFCTDLNRDGVPEYITRLDPAPSCVSARTIKVSELNLSSAEDLGCWPDQAEGPGIAGNDSLCSNTNWEITAQARSTFSETRVTVTQGVAVRLSTAQARAQCSAHGSGVTASGGGRPSSVPKKVRIDGIRKVVLSGEDSRSARDGRSTGTQGTGPAITQKRRRTYWFIHQDQ